MAGLLKAPPFFVHRSGRGIRFTGVFFPPKWCKNASSVHPPPLTGWTPCRSLPAWCRFISFLSPGAKPDHPVFSPLLTATLMGLGNLFTTQGGRPGADHSAGGGMSSPRLKAGVVGLADRQGKSGTPGLWPGLIFIGGALFQTPTTQQL